MGIYTKTRNLLRYPEKDVIDLAFGTFGSITFGSRAIPYNKVYDLSIQLKTARAIRYFFDFAIIILRPNHIISEEHPSLFYSSFFGKLLLCLFQPLLRFRKLFLKFELFVYAGYFGKITREHYEIFKPHPDWINAHCLAP